MEILSLQAQVRDTKVSPLFLRSDRKIPAVYYGNKEKSLSLQLDYQSFRKIFEKAGGNKIVSLDIDGKKKEVLIHEVQFHPLTDKISHVDFLHVNMNEEITAQIPVEIIGVAPAVKDLGGILTTLKHEIEVKCLPKDLPPVIQVDVSGLVLLHSSVHVSDLKLGKDVKIMTSMDDVIVSVSQAKEEAETPTPETVVEGAAAAPAAEGAAAATPAPEAKKE